MLPASKWKLVRPIVEESTCDPLLSTTLSETEWSMVEEKMPHFFPPYLTPKGECNAALEPLAVGVPEVLSPVLQGRDIRSYDDRCAQPKPQRLEAPRMFPGAHCSGPLYRQPEVGDGLASLSAELHEGTDPRDQGESPSGGVVPLFGPVRGPDPRRRG